ncbi:hypothetical protein GCM10009813_17960 [Brevibacterium marinum]
MVILSVAVAICDALYEEGPRQSGDESSGFIDSNPTWRSMRSHCVIAVAATRPGPTPHITDALLLI